MTISFLYKGILNVTHVGEGAEVSPSLFVALPAILTLAW